MKIKYQEFIYSRLLGNTYQNSGLYVILQTALQGESSEGKPVELTLKVVFDYVHTMSIGGDSTKDLMLMTLFCMQVTLLYFHPLRLF